MIKNIKKLFIIVSLILLSGCTARKNINIKPNIPQQINCQDSSRALTQAEIQTDALSSNKPVTVFVHGTLPIGLNVLVHGFDSPLGLVPACVQGNKFIHGRIPYQINRACPEQYPIDSFYLFGWTGNLSFAARRKAALDLYHKLKPFQGRHITVIGHSHGGNVAINLAEVARQHNDLDFKIDRLVLLASPVLAATCQNVSSPVFKKVYAFYSLGDTTQNKDPQGLYEEMRHGENKGKKIPLFTKRQFPDSPNLIQRRVLTDRRNIEHLDFIFMPFIRDLAKIINLLDSNPISYEHDPNYQLIINISKKRFKNNSNNIEQLVKCLNSKDKRLKPIN